MRRTGGRADGGSERTSGQAGRRADEWRGAGTLGRGADGGGQWADRRTRAGGRVDGPRADERTTNFRR